jgi:hypothetical protein
MITARDKAICADREVRKRRRVYSRLVAEGRMTGKAADKEIAVMQAIADDYRQKADEEAASERLI